MTHEIYTIGHSTRTLDDLIELLQAHGIERVIDVRTIPKSRHCPQFNRDRLSRSLNKAHIRYRHMKELGGLRHTTKESINTGWINASFRGFADYMQTPAFQKALIKLMKIAAGKRRCALLCAEAVPWRCHRSLIADALTVKKWKVFHIEGRKTARRHKRTSFLRVRGAYLSYPAAG